VLANEIGCVVNLLCDIGAGMDKQWGVSSGNDIKFTHILVLSMKYIVMFTYLNNDLFLIAVHKMAQI
jgi:hypothetical protein